MPKTATLNSPLETSVPNWRSVGHMALRALRRDWQSGELRVLAIALLIAVASVAAVGFFTDRIQQAMERKASELLGADWVVSAPNPIQALLAEEARRQNLRVAETLSFRSVVLAGDLTQLTEVKAVGPGYPLRGGLRVAEGANQTDQPAQGIPAARSGWADAQLVQSLGLTLPARVKLGDSEVTSAPSMTTLPDDTTSKVPSTCRNVDLPAPDAPTTATISPALIERSIPLSTSIGRPPNAKAFRKAMISTGAPDMVVARAGSVLVYLGHVKWPVASIVIRKSWCDP